MTNLGTNASLNAKINEVKGEIPSITNLATKASLNAVENKIPSVTNLVKKLTITRKLMKLKRKITDHNHDKYITTPEFNKLTSENFAARLKQANLASKSDIANFVNKTDFDNKLKDFTRNKNELNELSKKIRQYQQKD